VYGGAVYVDGEAVFTNCSFANNSAGNDKLYHGGAVALDGGQALFEGCTFLNNAAQHGGAVYIYGAGTFTDCSFSGNSAAVRLLNGRVTALCHS
jgi:hypothetical protein